MVGVAGEMVIATPDHDVYSMVSSTPPLTEMFELERQGGKPVLPKKVTRGRSYLMEDGSGSPAGAVLQGLKAQASQLAPKPSHRLRGKRGSSSVRSASSDTMVAVSGARPVGQWVVAEPGRRFALGTPMTLPKGAVTLGTRALVASNDGPPLVLELVTPTANFRDDWLRKNGLTFVRAPPGLSDGLKTMRDELDGRSFTGGVVTPRDSVPDPNEARALPLNLDARGERPQECRLAIDRMQCTPWPAWPVSGPRTCLWVLRFIQEHYGSPDVRHTRCVSDAKLTYADPGAVEHQACCRVLGIGASYDQLDLPQVASMEYTCSSLQMIELKHMDRVVVVGPGTVGSTTVPFNDTHLYMGWSATRGVLCVDPNLEKLIGEKLAEENLANTQRLKADELRQAATKPPGQKGDGGYIKN